MPAETYIVTLTRRSRFPRPAFGRFAHCRRFGGRMVWRREATSDIARLAELVDEASEFLHRHGGGAPGERVGVSRVETNAPEVGEDRGNQPVAETGDSIVADEIATHPATGDSAPLPEPKKRGRPKKTDPLPTDTDPLPTTSGFKIDVTLLPD